MSALSGSFPSRTAIELQELQQQGQLQVATADAFRALVAQQGLEQAYRHTHVVVASGARIKRLGVPGEAEFEGKGVSQCADCDGPMYQNETAVVVGGGDTAMEEALFLTRMCEKVTVVHRRDKFRAEPILNDRLMAKVAEGKVELKLNATLDEVLGDEKGVTGVRIKKQDGSTEDIAVTGAFIAIGHKPNTELFVGQLDMNNGYLKTHSGLEGNATATNIPGVFAAGDVQDHIYRQAITSAGTGCMAALDAQRYLESLS